VLSYLVTVTGGISVTAGPGFTLRHDVHSEDAIDSWDEDSIAAVGDSVVASWANTADPSAVWMSISSSFKSYASYTPRASNIKKRRWNWNWIRHFFF
jgi:hypothetical protein